MLLSSPSSARGATILVLLLSANAGCDAEDGAGGATAGATTGGASAECFMRATLEQADGTLVDYDVPSTLVNQDTERAGFVPVPGLDLVHDLRLSWPSDLGPGTYDFAGSNIGFLVITTLDNGEAFGDGFPAGTVTFTELGDGFSGTLTVERREPIAENDLYVVHATNVEFGCP